MLLVDCFCFAGVVCCLLRVFLLVLLNMMFLIVSCLSPVVCSLFLVVVVFCLLFVVCGLLCVDDGCSLFVMCCLLCVACYL